MAAIESLLAPPISPAPEAVPFWEAADRHELLLPFCGECEHFFFYPRALCPDCGSRDVQWRVASGRARL